MWGWGWGLYASGRASKQTDQSQPNIVFHLHIYGKVPSSVKDNALQCKSCFASVLSMLTFSVPWQVCSWSRCCSVFNAEKTHGEMTSAQESCHAGRMGAVTPVQTWLWVNLPDIVENINNKDIFHVCRKSERSCFVSEHRHLVYWKPKLQQEYFSHSHCDLRSQFLLFSFTSCHSFKGLSNKYFIVHNFCCGLYFNKWWHASKGSWLVTLSSQHPRGHHLPPRCCSSAAVGPGVKAEIVEMIEYFKKTPPKDRNKLTQGKDCKKKHRTDSENVWSHAFIFTKWDRGI